MRIKITNKSDKVIFVDLGTSHIKKNEIASAIYSPTITTTMIGQTVGLGVNVGAIGIGGMVGTTIGSSFTSAMATSTYAQRHISIPPKSSVYLEDIPILTPGSEKALGDIFYYDNVGKGPYKWTGCFSPRYTDVKAGDVFEFSEENTKFTIGCILNYSFNDDFKETNSIETTYYVKKVIHSSWGYGLIKMISDKEYNILDKAFPQWENEINSGNLELIRLWAL